MALGFGDGSTSTDQNPTHTYTSSGTYNVTLTATNSLGKIRRLNSHITHDLPTVTASVTESSVTANDGTVCATSSVTLSGSGASSYSWDNGITNAQAFTPASTTHTVTGTDVNGCENTAQQVITVNSLPTVTVSVNELAELGGTVCSGSCTLLVVVQIHILGIMVLQMHRHLQDLLQPIQ